MEDTPCTLFAIPRYSVGLIREGTIPIRAYPTINCSKEFADVFGAMFEQYDREHFAIACIDAKHKIIGFHTIAIGTLTMALVHPREVFKTAILLSSAACALFHNHPSGDPTPSREDRELTKRLEQAGELLGIHILDHIIFGANNRYYSFADQGFITGKPAS
jgi:DNA repair protein RadC